MEKDFKSTMLNTTTNKKSKTKKISFIEGASINGERIKSSQLAQTRSKRFSTPGFFEGPAGRMSESVVSKRQILLLDTDIIEEEDQHRPVSIMIEEEFVYIEDFLIEGANDQNK